MTTSPTILLLVIGTTPLFLMVQCSCRQLVSALSIILIIQTADCITGLIQAEVQRAVKVQMPIVCTLKATEYIQSWWWQKIRLCRPPGLRRPIECHEKNKFFVWPHGHTKNLLYTSHYVTLLILQLQVWAQIEMFLFHEQAEALYEFGSFAISKVWGFWGAAGFGVLLRLKAARSPAQLLPSLLEVRVGALATSSAPAGRAGVLDGY